MNGKAKKRPVEIHWFKWENNLDRLETWHRPFGGRSFLEDFQTEEDTLKINTLEGTSYNVPIGYYIIRGVAGEYYPCEPVIFLQTYKVDAL